MMDARQFQEYLGKQTASLFSVEFDGVWEEQLHTVKDLHRSPYQQALVDHLHDTGQRQPLPNCGVMEWCAKCQQRVSRLNDNTPNADCPNDNCQINRKVAA